MDCLFCKIIKGEIPSKKVYEDENVYAFHDIHPQAKVHLLFVHRNHTRNINEMADEQEGLAQMFQSIKKYTKESGLVNTGFRVVTNQGQDACQTVFHTHFHVLGGEQLSHFGA